MLPDVAAGTDRQGGTVRTQRFRLPRQHALRTAARGGEGAAAGGLREGRARFVPRGGDAAPRAGNGCGESLPRPGTALHRAARTDRYAQHPHRHGVCHASQTPRIYSTRASAGRTHMDGRADQGIGSRNHPRLHRKNAGGTGSRNNGSIQTKECNLHVGRTYRTTSCRYSV